VLRAVVRLQCFARCAAARVARRRAATAALRRKNKRALLAEVAQEVFAGHVEELMRLEFAQRAAIQGREVERLVDAVLLPAVELGIAVGGGHDADESDAAVLQEAMGASPIARGDAAAGAAPMAEAAGAPGADVANDSAATAAEEERQRYFLAQVRRENGDDSDLSDSEGLYD
jgi:hypothetical protein